MSLTNRFTTLACTAVAYGCHLASQLLLGLIRAIRQSSRHRPHYWVFRRWIYQTATLPMSNHHNTTR
jgi:hypothetical protein